MSDPVGIKKIVLREITRKLIRQHAQVFWKSNKKGIQVYSFRRQMRGATRAILKSEGTQPVVRDELMREVRNGRRPTKSMFLV